jgi:hypothetical protein
VKHSDLGIEEEHVFSMPSLRPYSVLVHRTYGSRKTESCFRFLDGKELGLGGYEAVSRSRTDDELPFPDGSICNRHTGQIRLPTGSIVGLNGHESLPFAIPNLHETKQVAFYGCRVDGQLLRVSWYVDGWRSVTDETLFSLFSFEKTQRFSVEEMDLKMEEYAKMCTVTIVHTFRDVWVASATDVNGKQYFLLPSGNLVEGGSKTYTVASSSLAFPPSKLPMLKVVGVVSGMCCGMFTVKLFFFMYFNFAGGSGRHDEPKAKKDKVDRPQVSHLFGSILTHSHFPHCQTDHRGEKFGCLHAIAKPKRAWANKAWPGHF